MKLAIALLLCGAAVVAGDTSNAPDSSPEKTGPKPGEILAKVSGKLRLARKDYRRLTKFERIAVKDARQEVFGQSAEGKAAAASLRTAAGLLETAAGREGVAEKKASQYRAIASALDAMGRSVSGAKPATQKTPEADLRKAAAALTKTWGDVMSKPRSDELQ
ncbi:MAG: hypothetical protein OER88_08100, partial [Planctomycetota bacterium]|nr:hypothetical protein [Planctomycetota bacterium]